jgi:peptidoglycan hydrolase-like protein with peptidoglycan-binding domain
MKKPLTHVAIAVALAFPLAAVAADEKQQSQQSQGASEQQASQSPELVKQAQEKLSAAGHDVGEADGRMGPKTQAALKDYQEKKGLQASGKLDQQTIAALGVNEGASASTGSTSEQKEPEQKQPEQKPKY